MKHTALAFLILLTLVFPADEILADSANSPIAQQLQLQNRPPQPSQPLPSPQFEDIRDIRGPVVLSDKQELLLPVALGVGVLLLVVLLIFFLRRKKPVAPLPNPGEIALAELNAAKSFIIEGQPLRYAERLSTILRRYIEDRFHIRSTRQTTREFLHCLTRNIGLKETELHNHTENLKECLERCDMAKFAHNSPGTNGMEKMELSVRNFVETTRSPENIQGGA